MPWLVFVAEKLIFGHVYRRTGGYDSIVSCP